jgi:dTDP-glucose pyrophosphorylase
VNLTRPATSIGHEGTTPEGRVAAPFEVDPASVTVLIPAAGPVSETVVSIAQVVTPAMIPVAGRPVIQWTVGYLTSLGFRRFRIAVPRRDLFVEDLLACVFGEHCQFEFVVPVSDRGLGGTVEELVRDPSIESALVVLGDTYFEFDLSSDPLTETPSVLVHQVDESYRWCIAKVDQDHRVIDLQDKVAGLSNPLDALIGVYWFPNAPRLREAVAHAIDRSPAEHVEMASLLDEFRDREGLLAFPARRWLDCGNPDTQAASQRSLLEQRAFNSLQVDSTVGTVTKRSDHRVKFIDEINYLRLLPPSIATLFPRIVSYSVEWKSPWLEIEFYGYPTLTELHLYERIDRAHWRRIFEHLLDVLVNRFREHEYPTTPELVRRMYIDKIFDRLETVTNPLVRRLADLDGVVTVNGQTLHGLAFHREALSRAVDELADTAIGSVIHGDLCFSNVLYDLQSGVCKFIDPRGSFGNSGIYGDLRYDVAKICHSAVGNYDFIVADLFDLVDRGDEIDFVIRSRRDHVAVGQVFEEVFFQDFSRQEILLTTASIFLSLPAMHYDHELRQSALFIRGLQLLEECLSPEGETT